MKLIRHEMLKISYLDKLPFKGSHQGIRYLIKKKNAPNSSLTNEDNKNTDNNIDGNEVKDSYILSLCIYPDEFCFENTAENLKKYFEFEYSNDGIDKAIEKLNEENKW